LNELIVQVKNRNMRQITLKPFLMMLVLYSGLAFSSCKNKAKENTNTTTDTSHVVTTPAEVTPDVALTKGVQDAVKDYPGVTASVSNGEVILGGTIERVRWVKLRQAIDALSPKKVNSDQLIIK
jgi:hypothetical protein